MRKSYLMMAAAATMLAACTQTDFVNEVPAEAPKAIAFENGFVNKATRSENSSSNYTLGFYNHHQNFKVWGYKNVSTTPVFDGRVVNVTLGSESQSEIYRYEGELAYWDESATSYQFYAAAPAGHDWDFNAPASIAEQDKGYFTTEVSLQDVNIHNDQGSHMTALGDAQDLLIAAPCQPTIGETVGLEFIHILSRLNIIVSKKSGMTEEVRSYEVSVKNIQKAGSFDEHLAAANPAGSYARWTTEGNNGEYKATNNDGALVQEGVERHVIQTLVIPQAVTSENIALNGSDVTTDSEPYLYVKYGVANATDVNGNATSFEIFEKYYNLAQIFGVTTGSTLPFNEGWENTLTLTIGPATIDFKASVATWASQVQKQNSLN